VVGKNVLCCLWRCSQNIVEENIINCKNASLAQPSGLFMLSPKYQERLFKEDCSLNGWKGVEAFDILLAVIECRASFFL